MGGFPAKGVRGKCGGGECVCTRADGFHDYNPIARGSQVGNSSAEWLKTVGNVLRGVPCVAVGSERHGGRSRQAIYSEMLQTAEVLRKAMPGGLDIRGFRAVSDQSMVAFSPTG